MEYEHAKSLQSCRLFGTPWTVTHQAPLSLGFSRQEWVAVSFSRDLPDPGIKVFPMSPELLRGFFTTRTTWEALK